MEEEIWRGEVSNELKHIAHTMTDVQRQVQDLRCEISTHEETIERLQDKIQTMQSDHHRERMELEAKHQSELNRREAAHTEETTRLKNRIAWQGHIIGCLSFLLLKTSDIFRKAVHCVIPR